MKHRRRYLTPLQKMRLIEKQRFICCCGCGEPLGTDPRDIEFDHRHSRWCGGSEDLENYGAMRKGHHSVKTDRETTLRAKCDRIAKRDGLRKRKPNQHDKILMRILKGN